MSEEMRLSPEDWVGHKEKPELGKKVDSSWVGQKWGVLDTKDNLWIGDEKGPDLFSTEVLAKISAQVMGVMAGYEPGRLRERAYPEGPVRLKDSVDTKMDARTALRRIEEGGAL